MSLKEKYIEITKKRFGGPASNEMIEKIGQSAISSIMRGSDIGVSMACKVAKALDVTVEELVGEERKPYETTDEEQERERERILKQVLADTFREFEIACKEKKDIKKERRKVEIKKRIVKIIELFYAVPFDIESIERINHFMEIELFKFLKKKKHTH